MLETLYRTIEEDLKLQNNESKKVAPGKLDSKWEFLTSSEPSRFINPDMTLRFDVLKNFRNLDVFILDIPTSNKGKILPALLRRYISGWRRGQVRLLKDMFDILRKSDALDLMKKYPPSNVGNPNLFHYKGYTYTFRWTRHILFLKLFKDILESRLDGNFISLDIGSSYGIFSSLLKKEYSGSHQILLDFPEQLFLAHYFLGSTFPDAKIASYKEIAAVGKIDRAFIEGYDFVLLPWFFYSKLCSNSLDVVSNFASLGEMRREWFDHYLKFEPFLSTKYFFTSNRFQSYPEYDTDLTILDYPLHDFKKLHFRISPYFLYYYKRKNLFFYEKEHYSSQYFEFIGERTA